MVYLVSQSSVVDTAEPQLSLFRKGHSWQYISEYPYSFLSNSIGI